MITRKAKQFEHTLSRRSFLLTGGQIALTSALVGRLFYLQIIESNRYEALSNRNRFDYKMLPPSRGRIFDSEGRLLAGNAEAYALNIVPSYTTDLHQSLRALSELIQLDDIRIDELMEKAEKQPSYLPLIIRDDLTQREVARVVVRGPELPGVSFDRIEKRIYPQGLLTGHLTGYVGRVSEDDIASGRVLPDMVNMHNGKSGVERALEEELRGQPGQERVLVNALGRPIKKSIEEAAIPGADINLTIDINLQSYATSILRRGRNKPISFSDDKVKRALAADPELASSVSETEGFIFEDSLGRVVPPETGSVVVIDIETGALKTIVSTPTFDPNLLSRRISNADWNQLVNHPRIPLLDRSIKGQYAPGSTFKMIVALAALEAGIINEKTRFFCPGHKDLGNARFHCWLKHGHGHVNVISGLEQSCDVFFYELALKTGIQRIASMAKKFGIGTPTDIMIPGEKPGLMPDKKWKEKHIGEVWTPGETVVASIGQGYVLTTPIQLAVMTARLANGKFQVSPQLKEGLPPSGQSDIGVSEASMAIIRRGMEAVVSGPKGTARNYQLDLEGVKMAGKTGTVQVKRITKAERERGIVDNMDRPWKFRDHALFVGYAPLEKPKYAIAVIVEHGGSGSSSAAPVARDIMTYLFEQSL
jgi:penicillin-binding protein 2